MFIGALSPHCLNFETHMNVDYNRLQDGSFKIPAAIFVNANFGWMLIIYLFIYFYLSGL